MKLILFILFEILLLTDSAKHRPYTTPSPYGSIHFKQFKCECSEKVKDLVYPNLTCYAKALSRDLTTLNGYVKLKKDYNQFWLSGYLEYKYGTIYRNVINVRKTNMCEILKFMENTENPMTRVIFSILKQKVPASMLHACPFKAGEEFYVYNATIPTDQIPSLFSQGDYRVKVFSWWPSEDVLLCTDTIVLSATSPIKESFG